MNAKTALAFIFGLMMGLGAGYIATDLHHRNLLRSAGPSAGGPTQGQKPEISGTEAMAGVHDRIRILEDLLDKTPGDLGARIELGNLYYDSGQFLKAIPHYQKAVEIQPNQPNVLSDLGTCYRETGNPEQAVRLFEQAFAADRTHWQSLYNVLVVSLHDLKDGKKAMACLRQLRSMNPPGVDLAALESEIRKLP